MVSRSKVLAIGLSVSLFVAAIASAAFRADSQPVEYIPAPEGWVPLTADLRLFHPGSDAPSTYGKYFRNSQSAGDRRIRRVHAR